jgi:ComF family protein
MVYESRWLDRLLPGTCILCGAASKLPRDLCAPCGGELPWNENACPRCAMPMPGPPGGACGRCLGDPPRFAACVAPLRYAYPVRELISRFKFNADLACGRLLSQLLAKAIIARNSPEPGEFTLVPVPLHPGRRSERGFNQAERIARVVARALRQTVREELVERVRQTPDQKQLGATARRANLRGAFQARSCSGLRVALVDDVLTTGATADALSAALLGAGAIEVHVWCLARAV